MRQTLTETKQAEKVARFAEPRRAVMTSSIEKKISHSLLIQEEELRGLARFIHEKFQEIRIAADCIDGTTLDTTDIEQILAFENLNYRKIKAITIDASSPKESISIKICTASAPAEFSVKSQSDANAVFYSDEVLKRLKEMKPSYDIFARVSFQKIFFSFWLGLGGLIGILQMSGKLPPAQPKFSTIDIINHGTILLAAVYGVGYVLDRFRIWLFPKVFFVIGKQKKTLERMLTYRKIVPTLALGIIASIIAALLLR